MSKINLEHFLVTNVSGRPGAWTEASEARSIPTPLKNVRHFNFEKPKLNISLFGLIVFPASFTAIGLLEKLIDEVKQVFEAETSFDEIAFEKLVGFWNTKLAVYAGSHKNTKDLERFDICLGAAIGDKLVLAPLGNISAILFLPDAGHFRYYNLMKEAQGAAATNELLKLKEIIAGNVGKNSTVIITTEELFNNYSFNDIGEIITATTAHGAVTNLQTALREQKISGTFTGFVLETMETLPHAPSGSAGSIKDLMAKRKETEKIIRSASPIDMKRATAKAKTIGAQMWLILSVTGRFLKRLLSPLAEITLLFLKALINWNNGGQANWEAIANFFHTKKTATTARLRQLTITHRVLLSLALVAVLAFTIGLARIALKNKTMADETRFEAAIKKITNLQTDAEAAFIQAGDNAQARNLLLEAAHDAETLKTSNATHLAELQTIRTEIQNRLMSFWKLQSITAPAPLAAFTALLPNEKILNAFSPDGKKVVAWSDKKIYTITNGQIDQTYNSDAALTETFDFTNNVVTIKTSTAGRLVQLALDERTLTTAEIDSWTGNLIDFVIQDSKLYALSNSNLFITKHLKSLTGYARGTGWLRDPIDVTNAVSLAIDGNLYTISSGGEIKKMYNGRLTDFRAEELEPRMTDTNKIWTSANTKFLFIENTTDARLILYDKKGTLVAQLKWNNLSALKNFYVNDSTRIPAVSLFDGNNVYYIDLTPYL